MTYPARPPAYQPTPGPAYRPTPPPPKRRSWTPLLVIGGIALAIGVPTCALFAYGVYLGATEEEEAPPPPVASGNGRPDPSGIVTLAAYGAPQSITVDQEAVYWTDIATGAVFKVGKQGGAVTKLSERPNSLPRLVKVDGDNVYWFEYAQSSRKVMKIPKAGGKATELTGAFDVGCMAIDPGGEKEGRLYWMWATVGLEDRTDTRVLQRPMDPPNVPKSGGKSEGWGGSRRPALCVAIDADNVYYVGRELGAPSWGLLVKRSLFNIYRLPRTGGEFTRIGNGACDFLELDAIHVYCGARERISRVPKKGGEQTELASHDVEDEERISGMAVDDTHVYYSLSAMKEGSVLRVSKAGGTVETVASGEYRPSHIAVDDTHVYWVNDGSSYQKRGGSVRKKKKK